jgi:hypothetical protein
MSAADLLRAKANHCRCLARESDDRTAASLEMLALDYDEDARRADIEAENAPLKRARPR